MSASKALAKAFPKSLKEVRLHLCQTGQASAGTRQEQGGEEGSEGQFIQNSYKGIKASNPELPFLVREAHGTPARIFARFERGVEKQVEVDGLSEQDVQKKFQELLT